MGRFRARFAWGLALAAAWPPIAVGEAPPGPVVFEDLGLDDFAGVESLAAALEDVGAPSQPESPLGIPVEVRVRGPSHRGNASDPLAAEFSGKLESFDLSAGMHADAAALQDGPATWTGGVGVSSDHGLGRDSLHLKTSVGRRQQVGVLGLEVGPRIERRLRGGVLFFLDGKAQAQARQAAETGVWQIPGWAESGAGTVGVAASTGIVR